MSKRMFSIDPIVTTLKDGKKIKIREAKQEDVSAVTKIIADAFKRHWNDRGYFTKPSQQTDELTVKYLLEKGFVAENESGEVVGTFGLDTGSLNFPNTEVIEFYQGNSEVVPFNSKNTNLDFISQKAGYLAFYKLSVRDDFSNLGLGQAMYQAAEEYARSNGYRGMILETSNLLPFLFDWYLNKGYEVIAGLTYPGSQIETLLLIKVF